MKNKRKWFTGTANIPLEKKMEIRLAKERIKQKEIKEKMSK